MVLGRAYLFYNIVGMIADIIFLFFLLPCDNISVSLSHNLRRFPMGNVASSQVNHVYTRKRKLD